MATKDAAVSQQKPLTNDPKPVVPPLGGTTDTATGDTAAASQTASLLTPEQEKARDKALAKMNQPTTGPMSPEQAVEDGESTVQMNFPRPVTLQLDNTHKVYFAAGVQTVPDRLKDHWYLKAAGATEWKPGAVPKAT